MVGMRICGKGLEPLGFGTVPDPRARSYSAPMCSPLLGHRALHQHHQKKDEQNGTSYSTTDKYDVPFSSPDAACIAAAKRDADPTVRPEEVRQILAKVPGTMNDTKHSRPPFVFFKNEPAACCQ